MARLLEELMISVGSNAATARTNGSASAAFKAAGATLEQWTLDLADAPAAADRLRQWLDGLDASRFASATLINNAGVAGAEEMVVDMSVDAWNYTLDANLVSNYFLMHHVAPLMKAQGSGYILNVSSYFGGEKYLAVAYPNRADYAVSKAGQRAMVESMARYLGPEVQFNAIAPGPVDGDRLSGTGGKPLTK